MNIIIKVNVQVRDDQGNEVESHIFESLERAHPKIKEMKRADYMEVSVFGEPHTHEVLLKMDCSRTDKWRTA